MAYHPLTHRETALILAGLRLLQEQRDGPPERILDVLRDDGGAVYDPSDVEIDALCDAINVTDIGWRRR